ncbi:hypothetical protein MPL3365_290073 [Mesorhizobium plurifarium]|uniref:Uncharacterized protein n=1 Tax=Mesorhizobium plurifarium TaxID=69974 RepID=A0A090GDE3_MESPL|nr:hypothetical protein MPL3365_290073 [Mesorhizobium plurifarium]
MPQYDDERVLGAVGHQDAIGGEDLTDARAYPYGADLAIAFLSTGPILADPPVELRLRGQFDEGSRQSLSQKRWARRQRGRKIDCAGLGTAHEALPGFRGCRQGAKKIEVVAVVVANGARPRERQSQTRSCIMQLGDGRMRKQSAI